MKTQYLNELLKIINNSNLDSKTINDLSVLLSTCIENNDWQNKLSEVDNKYYQQYCINKNSVLYDILDIIEFVELLMLTDDDIAHIYSELSSKIINRYHSTVPSPNFG